MSTQQPPPAPHPSPRFNPEMFIRAREAAGLNQTELAKAIGVTQGTISKVETGQLPPMPPMLEQAAEALEVRSSLFFRWPPHCVLPLTFHRKKVRLPATDLRRIHAGIALRRVALEVLTRAADVPENMLPAIRLDARGITPARAAQEVRIQWRLPRGPVENLTELLEDKGVVIFPEDFGTDLIAGVSTYEPSDGLPPTIFMNAASPPDRWRFTLAHELAHMVLHHHLPFPPDECEAEADEFASEFLMPESDIKGFLGGLTLEDAASLKRAWKTSMSSLVLRAATLERIGARQKQSLFIQMSKFGWRTREPVELDPEVPSLFVELSQAHIDGLNYSEEQLAVALDIPTGRLRADYLGKRASRGLRVVK
ncbi:XRE family transcriptional regulator [Corallococcus exiguus]|uniref:XRE family transcriptional regulator n=1 Tax=Corallococcus exiguus TaxID=83462 RepID=UPI0014712415|nr:XRE family transcriptional regulator [Corallococcus exiguus]NNB89655.1 ImmA/IrrE family metallo-endopeptidase [Corallococcus exiguus]